MAGGAGKTTLARWAARAALEGGRRPAVLLRGHGAETTSGTPQVVPAEAPGDPAAARRFGDEAIAHRAALPPSILVVAGKARHRAARIAAEHGADLIILDDGWEQGSLVWDHLWVAIDGTHPFGNGRTLPAGPLRRKPDNLLQANVIVEIDEAPDETRAGLSLGLHGKGVMPPRIRFRRRVESWRRLGGPATPTSGGGPPPHGPVLVISSVGAPERLERFLRGAGVSPNEHLAFPDHAAWDPALVATTVAALRARSPGALLAVVTDKDEARASLLPSLDLGLEVWVVRSEFEPVDDPAPLLAALRMAPRQAAHGGAPPDRLG